MTKKKEESGRACMRGNMLLEIVYALRQALLFSTFSFLLAVRGIRLHSLHSINILPSCPFSSSFLSLLPEWITKAPPIDARYKDAATGTFHFFCVSFLSFYPFIFLFLSFAGTQFIMFALLYLPYRTFHVCKRFAKL